MAVTVTEKRQAYLGSHTVGETRGEGQSGMIAVDRPIRNRVAMDLYNDGKARWWGVCFAGGTERSSPGKGCNAVQLRKL